MDFFEGWDAKRRGSDREAAPITAPVSPGAATPYALAALQGEVGNLLAVPIGSGRNDQLNRSAVKMYGLAAAGQIDERTVTETLGAADGGLDFPATRKTLQSARDAVFTRLGARTVPEPATTTTITREAVPPWERSDDPLDDNFDESLIARSTSSATGSTGSGAGSSGTTGDPRAVTSTPAPGEPAGGPTAGSASADPDEAYRAIVELEARKVRLSRDARRLVDQQDAEKAFRVPPSLLTLTDELAIPDEPVSYLIDELIPTGANVLITAQYKTGKTTLVNNLARSLVDGVDFLGRFGVEPFDGRVVLFNYEVDAAMYRRWLREVGIENSDRVSVLNLRGYRLPLLVPHVEDWVVAFLRERDARVWIIDPYARAAVGSVQDENDNMQAGALFDTLDVIKERAGVDVLVMPTHTGRAEQAPGEERARGATRIDDWPDVRWLLTKDKAGTRYFAATGRDVDFEESSLAFDEATRHLTVAGGSKRSNRERQLREFAVVVIGNLQNTPNGATTKLVQEGVRQMMGGRLDNNALGPVLDELTGEGRISREGNPRAGGYRYRVGKSATFDPLAS